MGEATAAMPHPPRSITTAPGFTGAEGLRALLERLAREDGWRTDPAVAELVAVLREKYALLARKWDRDPDEAVSAPFVVLRAEATRRARDPWAVVTDAVAKTLKAEAHAEWLLISTDRARRPGLVEHERPVRTSGDEEFLTRIAAPTVAGSGDDGLGWLADTLVGILAGLGWAADVAEGCVDYVLDHVIRAGRRETAFDELRRDITLPALYELPRESWLTLLRALLGGTGQTGTLARRGMIRRLLLGETAGDLLADDALVIALSDGAPGPRCVP
ncbi:MAG TPA: hypothetical protein VHA75_20075 [Rugosimonospora sp.]|nr:hypothetical protein [Rugosimonospora sp.]